MGPSSISPKRKRETPFNWHIFCHHSYIICDFIEFMYSCYLSIDTSKAAR